MHNMESIVIVLLSLINICYASNSHNFGDHIVKDEYIVKLRDSVMPHMFIAQNLSPFLRDSHFKTLNGSAFNGFAIRLTHSSHVEQLRRHPEVRTKLIKFCVNVL